MTFAIRMEFGGAGCLDPKRLTSSDTTTPDFDFTLSLHIDVHVPTGLETRLGRTRLDERDDQGREREA